MTGGSDYSPPPNTINGNAAINGALTVHANVVNGAALDTLAAVQVGTTPQPLIDFSSNGYSRFSDGEGHVVFTTEDGIGKIGLVGLVSRVNNIATAAFGVPAIYSYTTGTTTATSTTITVTFAVPSAGSYEVSLFVNKITTTTTDTISVKAAYTSQAGTVVGATFIPMQQLGVATPVAAALTAGGQYSGWIKLTASASTNIVITLATITCACEYSIDIVQKGT